MMMDMLRNEPYSWYHGYCMVSSVYLNECLVSINISHYNNVTNWIG